MNGWKYFEHRVTGQTTVTIPVATGLIDELRLYPEKTQMTTMTYDALVGMTSQCDANNRITYYYYDEFIRLVLIRDMEKQTIKKNCYNYSGQTESCNIYFNTQQSMAFAKQCSTGYTGSQVTYTITAEAYTSTVSQTDANQKATDDLLANGQNYANVLGTCTANCSPSNCTGANKKCINNICETGIKVYTDTYWDSGINKWICTYHYEWSDGSWSQNYTEQSNFACQL